MEQTLQEFVPINTHSTDERQAATQDKIWQKNRHQGDLMKKSIKKNI